MYSTYTEALFMMAVLLVCMFLPVGIDWFHFLIVFLSYIPFLFLFSNSEAFVYLALTKLD